MKLQFHRVCRVRCRLCGTVLEWRNRSKDDRGPGCVMYCQCGSIGMDPSACLFRILVMPPASFADMEELSEKWVD